LGKALFADQMSKNVLTNKKPVPVKKKARNGLGFNVATDIANTRSGKARIKEGGVIGGGREAAFWEKTRSGMCCSKFRVLYVWGI